MDDTTKRKLSVNIREINKNLMRIAEEKFSIIKNNITKQNKSLRA